jgi:EKC/KEOPS complex subunit CGI121/TPRKB
MTDLARVRKIYKLNGGGKNGVKVEGEDERKELEILVLGSIALRGSTN